MANINNIEISDDTLKLIRRIINFNNLQTVDKKDLIIQCFNSLRLDNGMNELDIENFNFTCPTAGNWNEKDKIFSISYSNFNPNIPQIISTILHEFRHCWQYFNKLELDNLIQQNLDGPLSDSYTEYHIQPIEQDAFRFEHDATSFITQNGKKNEKLLGLITIWDIINL